MIQAPSFQDASVGRGIKPRPTPLPQLPLPPQLPQLSSLDPARVNQSNEESEEQIAARLNSFFDAMNEMLWED